MSYQDSALSRRKRRSRVFRVSSIADSRHRSSVDSGSDHAQHSRAGEAASKAISANRGEQDTPAVESSGLGLPSVPRFALALLLFLVTLPVLASIGLLSLLLQGRPVFYRQARLGLHGRPFQIWKFRTMLRNAELKTGPVWCQERDCRVTGLGRVLRATHLDELPQVINILRGDMNLVGPRPERPELAAQLAEQIPGYRRRLQVRPGITGLAQVRQGYDRSISDVRRKVAFDLVYINRRSAIFDCRIVFSTIPFVINDLWHRTRYRILRRRLKLTPAALTQERVLNPLRVNQSMTSLGRLESELRQNNEAVWGISSHVKQALAKSLAQSSGTLRLDEEHTGHHSDP